MSSWAYSLYKVATGLRICLYYVSVFLAQPYPNHRSISQATAQSGQRASQGWAPLNCAKLKKGLCGSPHDTGPAAMDWHWISPKYWWYSVYVFFVFFAAQMTMESVMHIRIQWKGAESAQLGCTFSIWPPIWAPFGPNWDPKRTTGGPK